jgi:hypothetical protein
MIRTLVCIVSILAPQLLLADSLQNTSEIPRGISSHVRLPVVSLAHEFAFALHPGFPGRGDRESFLQDSVEHPLFFANLGEDMDASEDELLPATADSVQADSMAHERARRLLPEKMSIMERWVWGEDGAVRSLGIASPLTVEVRKNELGVRRTMLTAHQIGGFATLGLMIATVYYGQKALDTGSRSYRRTHTTLAAFTIGAYAATASLAIFSPPPLIRRDETSTTTIHKTLAWIHFAGMIATPILGRLINRRGSSYYDQARIHQVSAYITTAVFAASMIVITF